MPTTEARPRIPADLVDRINVVRGTASFEGAVRNLLSRAVGDYIIAPDPEHPKRYRVGCDGDVIDINLTKRAAIELVEDLALVSSAYNALSQLHSNLSAAGSGLTNEADTVTEAAWDLLEKLRDGTGDSRHA